MEMAYKGNDCVKKVRLQTHRGELESIRMKETERVTEYNSHVETMENQLGRNIEILPTS